MQGIDVSALRAGGMTLVADVLPASSLLVKADPLALSTDDLGRQRAERFVAHEAFGRGGTASQKHEIMISP